MKVYILWIAHYWDPLELVSIHETKDSAEKEKKRLIDTGEVRIYIDEHEVKQ